MKVDSAGLLKLKFSLTKTWYHGTFVDSYEQIQEVGIDVNYNLQSARRLDFGPGFYLTSFRHQAERFTALKQRQTQKGKLGRALPKREPCVIEYELDIDKLIQNFEGLYHLEYDSDFAYFIAKNRTISGLNHSFDFVFGKVADGIELNDKTLAFMDKEISEDEYIEAIRNRKYQDDDQLSIHNQKICDILKEINMYRL